MFDVGDRIIGLELPDTFYKLAELLEQDQFELLLSKNRIKDMQKKGKHFVDSKFDLDKNVVKIFELYK